MKNDRKVVSTGTISIFLVLVVLLFVTFSLLSLTLSTSDLRLSERAARTTSEYYIADDTATRRLYSYIATAELEGTDAAADAVEADGGRLDASGNEFTISFSVPVSGGLSLFAEVRITLQGGTASEINIIRWQCAGNEQ
ncbi:MAG: hypothetical protein GX683_01890 [Ruminococcaceae bacterium]|nr:hypothetical protein [Oscillospiraceae bacterium]